MKEAIKEAILGAWKEASFDVKVSVANIAAKAHKQDNFISYVKGEYQSVSYDNSDFGKIYVVFNCPKYTKEELIESMTNFYLRTLRDKFSGIAEPYRKEAITEAVCADSKEFFASYLLEKTLHRLMVARKEIDNEDAKDIIWWLGNRTNYNAFIKSLGKVAKAADVVNAYVNFNGKSPTEWGSGMVALLYKDLADKGIYLQKPNNLYKYFKKYYSKD